MSTAVSRSIVVGSLDEFDRVVVVVPHPDDESLACGMLLASAAADDVDVRVIAVTDGERAYPDVDPSDLAEVRRGEQVAALAVLGIAPTSLVRLGLPDGSVAEHVQEVADAIGAHRTDRSLVVAPSRYDWHPDHEACGLAARSALTDTAATHWSSLFWAHHHVGRLIASSPDFVRFAGGPGFAATRAAAIECHRSQFHHPTGGAPILTHGLLHHLDERHELHVLETM